MSSYKTPLLGALLALLLGCTPDGSSSRDDSTFLEAGPPDVREPDATSGEAELGEDWLREASARSDAGGSRAAARGEDHYWSILLATFAGPGHDHSARTFITSSTTFDSRLRNAHVVTDEKGSRALFGRYERIDDEAAQRDLKWIKSIESEGLTVFPTSMLVRIRPEKSAGEIRPIDLMALRHRYPDVEPLSTLQVAVWGDFGKSGQLSWNEIRGQAESYARDLRSRGFEAFVHHDQDKRMSIVTVGAFDRTAYDAQSGFESAELAALRRRFPVHLVNGEPMRELISKFTDETQPQIPRLVEVPR